jgi:DNA transformation protein
MADEQAFVDYLMELLDDFGSVTAKRMFGGYGIFRDGLMFGLVTDSTLYLKVDQKNQPDFEAQSLSPFIYMKKDRPVAMSYYQAPSEALDNVDAMHTWAESAFQAALRAQKKKKK